MTPGGEELKNLRDEEAQAERIRLAAKVEYEARLLAEAREQVRQEEEREKLEYQRRGSIDRDAPRYDGITFGSGLLQVLAVLTWVGSLIACVAMVNEHFEGTGLMTLAYGIVSGGLLWMLGSIGLAIRDMARNSFRR